MFYSTALGLDHAVAAMRVFGILACLWAFQSWSESRWLGIGKCGWP